MFESKIVSKYRKLIARRTRRSKIANLRSRLNTIYEYRVTLKEFSNSSVIMSSTVIVE